MTTTAWSERATRIWTAIRDNMIANEPDFVEGELVRCYNGNSLVDEGTIGRIAVEWVDTKHGVVCNCFFLSVKHSDGHTMFCANLENTWESIDPRWAKKKGR